MYASTLSSWFEKPSSKLNNETDNKLLNACQLCVSEGYCGVGLLYHNKDKTGLVHLWPCWALQHGNNALLKRGRLTTKRY